MSKAFIIGNGYSRHNIDCEKLKSSGIVIGCNVIYREFDPHYIAAVDQVILKELSQNLDKFSAPIFTTVETNTARSIFGKENYKRCNRVSFTGNRKNSGMVAFHLAVRKRYNPVYLVGFDFGQVLNIEGADHGNIFEGTPGYTEQGKKTRKNQQHWPRFHGIDHFNCIMKEAYDNGISIIRVIKYRDQADFRAPQTRADRMKAEYLRQPYMNHMLSKDFIKLYNVEKVGG